MGVYSIKREGRDLYGLKNDEGEIVLHAEYPFYEEANDIFIFSKDMGELKLLSSKYITDVVYYNKKGENLNKYSPLSEGYAFNEDGLAVVVRQKPEFTEGLKYLLMTKKGNISSFPSKTTDKVAFKCVVDLEQAIKDVGAVAVKYATIELIANPPTKDTMNCFKNALKHYLKAYDYAFKSEEECKEIIKKEYDLFNKLVEEKEDLLKQMQVDEQTIYKRNKFIDDLIK